MAKRILSLTLTFILIFSCILYVTAEGTLPTSLEKPKDLALRSEHHSTINVRWTNPSSILKILEDLLDSEYYADLSYLVDWKKNDGNWNVAIPSSDPSWDGNLNGQFSGYLANTMSDEVGVSETFFVTWHLDPTMDASSSFDLKNNTYYFRIRYLLEPYDGEFEPVYSSYSEIAAIGKNAGSTAITKLDAPQNLKVLVKKDSGDKPYFQLDWTIPESITIANKQLPVYHFIDFKVGNGKWLSETTQWDGMPGAPSNLLMSTDTLNPVEKNIIDKVVIEENTYYFRVAFVCEPPNGQPVISAYSNVASTRVEAYSDASNWAKPELDSAHDKGLIPERLIGADMTKPITREEFAEVAIKLYETTTGKDVSPVSPNPFTDTKNPEILKAFKVGIVAGMTDTTFKPKDLTNREQVAAMLSRAIRAMVPDIDYSTEGAPTFLDQKDISGWALKDVLFMSKLGIIKGSTDGKFMPKATTTAQKAAGYATTTRQEAIAMSVRTFDRFSK